MIRSEDWRDIRWQEQVRSSFRVLSSWEGFAWGGFWNLWDLHWKARGKRAIPHAGTSRNKGMDSSEDSTRGPQEGLTGLRCVDWKRMTGCHALQPEGWGLPRPLTVISQMFPSGNILHFKILTFVRKSYHSPNTRLLESRTGKEFRKSSDLRTNLSCLVRCFERCFMSPSKLVHVFLIYCKLCLYLNLFLPWWCRKRPFPKILKYSMHWVKDQSLPELWLTLKIKLIIVYAADGHCENLCV